MYSIIYSHKSQSSEITRNVLTDKAGINHQTTSGYRITVLHVTCGIAVCRLYVWVSWGNNTKR